MGSSPSVPSTPPAPPPTPDRADAAVLSKKRSQMLQERQRYQYAALLGTGGASASPATLLGSVAFAQAKGAS